MGDGTTWIQTSRVCSCCGYEFLYAKLTAPEAVFRWGKRLYTYCCRRCDFSGSPAGFADDPRDDLVS